MMDAAIYIRVSTLDQAREGYSLAAQEYTLRRWCDQNGHNVVAVYADEGISAKDIHHRPAMQQLLLDVKQHKFDMVLVWALSRFTRSVSDLYNCLSILDANHVQFKSYTEPFDTSSVFGRAVLGILGVFAQLERELTAERVRAAMDERARQGMRTCSYVLGYDSIKGGGLKVNPTESKIVKFIFDTYLTYQNIVTISALCQRRGYTGKRGAKIEPESVHKILTRPIYCGFYSWHGTLISGDFEPIIGIEQFNAVQDIIEQRGKKVGRSRRVPLIRVSEHKNGSTL